MEITFKQSGDFKNLTNFMQRCKHVVGKSLLDKYGERGVAALSAATPIDSGETASSWYYEVDVKKGSAEIKFLNRNIQNGVPIAIILQYGHGTRTSGWVEGIDYINPAIQPIFNEIVEDAWKEVTA